MKILLIRPRMSEGDRASRGGPAWNASRYILRKTSGIKLGECNLTPPLALMTVAALTPPGFDVAIADDIVEEIDFDADVDLVGITTLTASVYRAYEIADQFMARGVKVVLGGVHATLLPDEAAGHADTVVVGQAEGVWPQVCIDAKNGSLNRFYRNPDYCDLRNMPLPRRDLLRERDYLSINILQATRGCPNRCSFCSIHAVAGDTFRSRPVDDIISEIATFSNPLTLFVDDNIIGDPAFAKKLFKALIPMRITWLGQATLEIAEDDELLDLAAKSGCKLLIFGFESLSQEGIRKIGKAQSNQVSDYGEVINKVHARGIAVDGCFILGLDTDDNSVFERTVEFILENNIDIPHASILTPYPGTRLFKQLETEGRLIHKDWRHYWPAGKEPVYRPKLMTVNELYEGQRFFWESIYSLRPIAKRLISATRHTSLAGELFLAAVNLMQNRRLKTNLLVFKDPPDPDRTVDQTYEPISP